MKLTGVELHKQIYDDESNLKSESTMKDQNRRRVEDEGMKPNETLQTNVFD
jgi:hypothetical protein